MTSSPASPHTHPPTPTPHRGDTARNEGRATVYSLPRNRSGLRCTGNPLRQLSDPAATSKSLGRTPDGLGHTGNVTITQMGDVGAFGVPATNVIGGGNLDARPLPRHPEAEAPPYSCLLQRRPRPHHPTGHGTARAHLGRRGRSL